MQVRFSSGLQRGRLRPVLLHASPDSASCSHESEAAPSTHDRPGPHSRPLASARLQLPFSGRYVAHVFMLLQYCVFGHSSSAPDVQAALAATFAEQTLNGAASSSAGSLSQKPELQLICQ